MISPSFEVAGTFFGPNHPPVVIAEIGINHAGNLAIAKKMAKAAIDAGLKFIKHQTHIPTAEMSEEAKRIVPGNSSLSIFEVISQNHLSEADERKLAEYVNEEGGVFFSTPFSREAADRLANWDVPLFKIGSGECNNFPLIRHIAAFGKPVILSTGMNSRESISTAVGILRANSVPFALLHTTNLYPTPQRLVRLGGVTDLASWFPDAVVGLSDHSLTNSACIASVGLGASILERHFTDTRRRSGPDILCSMNPREARELRIAANEVFLARGGGREPAPEEKVTIAFAMSSVVATQDLSPGEVLGPENIWVKRPSGGDFSAKDYESLFGRRLRLPILANHQLTNAHLFPEK